MRTKSLKKNKINVVTLGCSKNVYDSEVLMGQLKASGKDVVHEEEGNIVVINTCGFINNVHPECTVSTHSVWSRSVTQGTLSQYASFCSPPESVKIMRAPAAACTISK
jgi:hypothetical protein